MYLVCVNTNILSECNSLFNSELENCVKKIKKNELNVKILTQLINEVLNVHFHCLNFLRKRYLH